MRSDDARRILVTEDDADVRHALEGLFLGYGYETSLAEDGTEALALLESGVAVHFIVLDLMMPRMSGFEFLKRKRGLPAAKREIPVAITSSFPVPFAADVVAVFHKPTPVLDLLKVVERHVGPGNASSAPSAG